MENNSSFNKNYDFIFGVTFGITIFATGTIFGILITKLINSREKLEHGKKTTSDPLIKPTFFEKTTATSKVTEGEDSNPLASPAYFKIPTTPHHSIPRSQSYTVLSRDISFLPEEISFKTRSGANSFYNPQR